MKSTYICYDNVLFIWAKRTILWGTARARNLLLRKTSKVDVCATMVAISTTQPLRLPIGSDSTMPWTVILADRTGLSAVAALLWDTLCENPEAAIFSNPFTISHRHLLYKPNRYLLSCHDNSNIMQAWNGTDITTTALGDVESTHIYTCFDVINTLLGLIIGRSHRMLL